MRRNTTRITAAGRPVSWLGVNFWSRAGGPLMWRSRRCGPQPSRLGRHYRRLMISIAALAGRVGRGIPQLTHTMA
jgi:hypothetical protein